MTGNRALVARACLAAALLAVNFAMPIPAPAHAAGPCWQCTAIPVGPNRKISVCMPGGNHHGCEMAAWGSVVLCRELGVVRCP